MNFNKILSYILSPLFTVAFLGSLLIFELIQRICYNFGGYEAHKKSVDYLNFCLMQTLRILGIKCSFTFASEIPKNKPLIVVANHQGMYDIIPIIWYMRQHHVKFVAKKELDKGVPSISYNLQKGGSVMIDRKDAKNAILLIKKFAQYIQKNKYAAVIFPEGTRSKDGTPKPFQTTGLKVMAKYMPDAYFVPITINNSYKILQNGYFPLPVNFNITWQVHSPIKNSMENIDIILDEIETIIKSKINKTKE